VQSFCALARIDISGFAARVDEQYARSRSDFKQPPLNRKKKKKEKKRKETKRKEKKRGK